MIVRPRWGGTCLNDFLLDGPNLATDIRGVIMRFRDGSEVAVAADIKDFFHEVYVDKKDAAAFRYYWFIDGAMKEVNLNEFLGHVFGAKSSGCVATFTLRYHIDKNAVEYGKQVVEASQKNFYVDDLAKSLRNTAVAKNFRKAVTKACKDAGMELCKWRSTHAEVLRDDEAPNGAGPVDSTAPASAGEIDKILGM